MTSIDLSARSRTQIDDPLVGAIIAGFFGYLAALLLVWKAVVLWAPDQVAVTLMGHHLHVGDLHKHLYAHGVEAMVLFPALFVLELALQGWENSSMRTLLRFRPSARTDFMLWLLAETRVLSIMVLVFGLGVGLIGGEWVHDAIVRYTGLNLTTAGWPVWLQAPVLLLIFTFFDYWNHRLDHTSLFWPLHRYHHSADEFCIITASRVHPALFTSVVTVVGPAAVLSASGDAMLQTVILAGFVRNVIHSRIDSDFGFIGRWLIQSPNHHRRHHGLDVETLGQGHFSLCPLWDRLFGTWRGEANQTLAIGVDDATYRDGLWIAPDLLRDYMDFWKGWIPKRKQAQAPSTAS